MRQLRIIQQITQRNENSINRYFQEVNNYPLITVDEEVELSIKIRQGDEMALQKLVESNLRFVISVAKQYQNRGLSFPDLINEGNMGLVKAARKFDETRGFKFISYAVWWIRQSIIQAISEQTRIVRLPVNRIAGINKISKATTFLEQQLEREPTNSELAEYLEIDEELINENNSIKHHQLSFDNSLSSDSDSDFSLYDLIQSDNIPAPDAQLDSESTKINIERALTKLSSKEKMIITMFYGLEGNSAHNLHEIANLMNISGERIRQIKNSGLKKMKQVLSGKTCFHNNV